jgi:hypothetical protein
MFLTSVLFTIDAYLGSFSTSRANALVYHLPGGPWTWAGWALTFSTLLLAGMFTQRWRVTLAGLLGLAIWYAGQTTIVIVNWNKGGHVGLLGPVGVYGLVLFPKAITHAVTVVLTGRRLGQPDA